MRGRNRSNLHRQRLAYEAARIMVEQGVGEFDRVRRKAAKRIGIGDKRKWPRTSEIQEALLQQRRLFQGERQDRELKSLREQALAAMHAFAEFSPRLVGPLLAGSADPASGVRLHLFTDNPEDLVFALLDRGIPWQEGAEIFLYGGGVRRSHPVFAFIAGETRFALVALPLGALRNPPLDPINERAERGAGTEEVAGLLRNSP